MPSVLLALAMPTRETAVVAAYPVLLVCPNRSVWGGEPSWFRAATELWVVGWLALYRRPGGAPWALFAGAGGLWLLMLPSSLLD
jgi:hypothetical protein